MEPQATYSGRELFKVPFIFFANIFGKVVVTQYMPHTFSYS